MAGSDYIQGAHAIRPEGYLNDALDQLYLCESQLREKFEQACLRVAAANNHKFVTEEDVLAAAVEFGLCH